MSAAAMSPGGSQFDISKSRDAFQQKVLVLQQAINQRKKSISPSSRGNSNGRAPSAEHERDWAGRSLEGSFSPSPSAAPHTAGTGAGSHSSHQPDAPYLYPPAEYTTSSSNGSSGLQQRTTRSVSADAAYPPAYPPALARSPSTGGYNQMFGYGSTPPTHKKPPSSLHDPEMFEPELPPTPHHLPKSPNIVGRSSPQCGGQFQLPPHRFQTSPSPSRPTPRSSQAHGSWLEPEPQVPVQPQRPQRRALSASESPSPSARDPFLPKGYRNSNVNVQANAINEGSGRELPNRANRREPATATPGTGTGNTHHRSEGETVDSVDAPLRTNSQRVHSAEEIQQRPPLQQEEKNSSHSSHSFGPQQHTFVREHECTDKGERQHQLPAVPPPWLVAHQRKVAENAQENVHQQNQHCCCCNCAGQFRCSSSQGGRGQPPPAPSHPPPPPPPQRTAAPTRQACDSEPQSSTEGSERRQRLLEEDRRMFQSKLRTKAAIKPKPKPKQAPVRAESRRPSVDSAEEERKRAREERKAKIERFRELERELWGESGNAWSRTLRSAAAHQRKSSTASPGLPQSEERKRSSSTRRSSSQTSRVSEKYVSTILSKGRRSAGGDDKETKTLPSRSSSKRSASTSTADSMPSSGKGSRSAYPKKRYSLRAPSKQPSSERAPSPEQQQQQPPYEAPRSQSGDVDGDRPEQHQHPQQVGLNAYQGWVEAKGTSPVSPSVAWREHGGLRPQQASRPAHSQAPGWQSLPNAFEQNPAHGTAHPSGELQGSFLCPSPHPRVDSLSPQQHPFSTSPPGGERPGGQERPALTARGRSSGGGAGSSGTAAAARVQSLLAPWCHRKEAGPTPVVDRPVNQATAQEGNIGTGKRSVARGSGPKVAKLVGKTEGRSNSGWNSVLEFSKAMIQKAVESDAGGTGTRVKPSSPLRRQNTAVFRPSTDLYGLKANDTVEDSAPTEEDSSQLLQRIQAMRQEIYGHA